MKEDTEHALRGGNSHGRRYLSLKRRLWVLLLLLIIAALCILGLRRLNTLPGQFSNALDTDLYNCSLTVQPAPGLTSKHAVHLTLEWAGWRDYTRLDITTGGVEVVSVGHARATRRWLAPCTIAPGAPYTLLVMRRGDWLALLHEGTLLLNAQVPHPPGTSAGISAEPGWQVVDAPTLERREPVVFADNFMRSSDDPGNWHLVSGQWHLLSAWDADPHGNGERFVNNGYAQNPFAWLGHADAHPAICTTGKPSWEDYTLSFAVQPRNGAVGALVNMSDARNGVLVRWSAANDSGPDGGQLILYRLTDGRRSELARAPGGYLPGLWYRLSVVSGLQGVHVLIDGVERLAATNVTPWHGAIGLYAEGKRGAVFDTLTAYGRTLNIDMIDEAQQIRLSQRILDDKEMQKWAQDWENFPRQSGAFRHQRSFYGDQRLILHVTPKHGMGSLTMVLNGNGEDFGTGYRAVVERGFDGKLSYTLYRNGEQLASAAGRQITDDDEYTLRFWRQGDQLWLEQDGVTVVSVQERRGLPDTRAAYRVEGCFAGEAHAVVLCRNVLDYPFTEAPADWVGEGTWAPTVRWACDPRWSFLGGWSHGDAVLWHKQRFTGDQTFEAYLAPMMEYPRARVRYGERYCDMCLTICGDGHNPRSGYAALYGAPDAQGNLNKCTLLLRNGVVVASVNLYLPPKDEVHKQWSHLELQKRGAEVALFIDGQRALSYTDPHPIAGGVPALWTTDNGLTIARARLYFTTPPQPRHDDWLAINAPDYPEWGTVGTPLTLNFSDACAASGKPVGLRVTARDVPAGETAPQVHEHAVTFTPRKIGAHWYQVCASDGATDSPSVHLLLPVFNPALRRDDSHALVLYRFNEGHGNRVHDQAHANPPADIVIPAGSPAHWLPGRGLALPKPTMLQTAAPVSKLQAINRAQAATIECWLSYATLYPPTTPPIYWEGNVVSWEGPGNRRNFCYGFHSFNLEIGARTGSDLQKFNPLNCWTPYNHIGLQHQVVTWDGHYTRFYVNGKLVDTKHYKWEVERWLPGLPLTFGNEFDGQRPFLGSYYLLAIHDCALSDAQILRHYQAGPSA